MLTLSADFGLAALLKALLELYPILVYLLQRRHSVVAHLLPMVLGSFGTRSSFPVGNPFRLPVRFLGCWLRLLLLYDLGFTHRLSHQKAARLDACAYRLLFLLSLRAKNQRVLGDVNCGLVPILHWLRPPVVIRKGKLEPFCGRAPIILSRSFYPLEHF
jgi:hypothetical protein